MRRLTLLGLIGLATLACGRVSDANGTDPESRPVDPDDQTGNGNGGTGGVGAGGVGAGGVGAGGSDGGESGGTGGFDPSLLDDPFAGDWGDSALIPGNFNSLRVAVDGEGRVYLAGATRSPGVLDYPLPAGRAGVSFVLGLDAEGDPLFRVTLPECGTIAELVLDASGAPWFACPVVTNQPTVLDGLYGPDTYVAKLNPVTGAVEREATLESENALLVQGLGLAPSGVVYLAGSRYDENDYEVTELYELDAEGNFTLAWAPAPPIVNHGAYPNSVAVLTNGTPVVTGGFYPELTTGSVTIESKAVYSTYTLYNGFVALPGAALPLTRFGGTSFDLGLDVEALASGGFAVAGWVEGNGDVAGTNYLAPSDSSTLIALYSSTHTVTKTVVLPAAGVPEDLTIAPNGHALVVGHFLDSSLVKDYDIALDDVSSLGSVSSDNFRGVSVAGAPDGSIWLTGTIYDSVEVNGVPYETPGDALLLHLPAP